MRPEHVIQMENLRLTPVECHKTCNLCNTAIVPKKKMGMKPMFS